MSRLRSGACLYAEVNGIKNRSCGESVGTKNQPALVPWPGRLDQRGMASRGFVTAEEPCLPAIHSTRSATSTSTPRLAFESFRSGASTPMATACAALALRVPARASIRSRARASTLRRPIGPSSRNGGSSTRTLTSASRRALTSRSVDIDEKSGGLATFDALVTQYGEDVFRSPYRVRTGGGGLHLAFRSPPGTNSRNAVLAGIDRKAEGGMIVAACSRHRSGSYYQFDRVSALSTCRRSRRYRAHSSPPRRLPNHRSRLRSARSARGRVTQR